jgi:hypothetical protein
MNDGYVMQAVAYIQQCLSRGMNEADIRVTLMNTGWPQPIIDEAFRRVYNDTPVVTAGQAGDAASSPQHVTMVDASESYPLPAEPSTPQRRHVRAGVLWILSPGLFFLFGFLMSFLLDMFNLYGPAIDMINAIAGIVMPILLFAGPVVGIALLTRRQP